MANAAKFIFRPKGGGVDVNGLGTMIRGGKVEPAIATNGGHEIRGAAAKSYGAGNITGTSGYQKVNSKIFSEKGQVPGADASSLRTIDQMHSTRRSQNKEAREILGDERTRLTSQASTVTDPEEAKKLQGVLSSLGREMNSLRMDSALSFGRQGLDYAKRAGAWSMEGNGWDKAKKVGILAGGAAAVNGTGRMLSGGGVTYNNDGERDIMGVPFV